MKKPEVNFDWGDGGYAGVASFVCVCGNELVKARGYSVEQRGTEDCPKCGRVYRYVWIGMIVEEVNEGST